LVVTSGYDTLQLHEALFIPSKTAIAFDSLENA